MPRVKQFDQEEALNKAMELFWEKGYASTSLRDLTQHLGIGKGSFYDTFQGKRELFERSFNLYRTSNIKHLERMLASEPDVRKGIRLLLNNTLQSAITDPKRKGCFVANTCSEMGGADEEVKHLLIAHHQQVKEILSNYLLSDSSKSQVQADAIAETLITFLTGLQQEFKFKQDRDGVQRSLDLLMRLLD